MTDREYDRLIQLLDVGTDALKRNDFDTAMMAVKEAHQQALVVANVICLPDRSHERIT